MVGTVQEGQLSFENKRAGGGLGFGSCLGGRTPEDFCDILRAGPDDTRTVLVLLYEHEEAVWLNLAGLIKHPRVCLDLRFRWCNRHPAFFAIIRLQHLGIVAQHVAGHFRKCPAALLPNSERATQTLALEGAGNDALLLLFPSRQRWPFRVDFLNPI